MLYYLLLYPLLLSFIWEVIIICLYGESKEHVLVSHFQADFNFFSHLAVVYTYAVL